ncbi:uncharacterized protein LOC144031465 [Festucalex cinctus]
MIINQTKELLLLLFSALLSQVQCECQTGWLEKKDKCYYFSKDNKTWKEANDFCLSQDSNLTSILDINEMKWLNTTLGQANAWLGLTDDPQSVWRWTDGNPFNTSISNWGQDQLNNVGKGKQGANCVAMVASKGGSWDNYDCNNSTQKYICKSGNFDYIMVPKNAKVLNFTEQQALELVRKMAISGKVVAKQDVNVTATNQSLTDVTCSRTVVMKRNEMNGFLSGELVGGLKVGSIITIRGRVTDSDPIGFYVQLYGDRCISLYVGSRLIPLKPGRNFEVSIQCAADKLHVSTDGITKLSFKYKVGLHTVTHVAMYGDLQLIDVRQM